MPEAPAPRTFRSWIIRSVLYGTAGLGLVGALAGACGLASSEYHLGRGGEALFLGLNGAIYGFQLGLAFGIISEFVRLRRR